MKKNILIIAVSLMLGFLPAYSADAFVTPEKRRAGDPRLEHAFSAITEIITLGGQAQFESPTTARGMEEEAKRLACSSVIMSLRVFYDECSEIVTFLKKNPQKKRFVLILNELSKKFDEFHVHDGALHAAEILGIVEEILQVIPVFKGTGESSSLKAVLNDLMKKFQALDERCKLSGDDTFSSVLGAVFSSERYTEEQLDAIDMSPVLNLLSPPLDTEEDEGEPSTFEELLESMIDDYPEYQSVLDSVKKADRVDSERMKKVLRQIREATPVKKQLFSDELESEELDEGMLKLVDQAIAEMESVTDEAQELVDKNNRLNETVVALRAELELPESISGNIIAERDAQIETLDEQVIFLRGDLEVIKGRLKYKTELNDAQVLDLQNQAVEIERMIGELQGKASAINRLSREKADLSKRLIAIQGDLNTAQDELGRKGSECRTVNRHFARVKDELAREKTLSEEQTAELKAKIAEINEELANAKRQLDRFRELSSERDALANYLIDLVSAFKKVQDDCKRQQECIERQAKELRSNTAEIARQIELQRAQNDELKKYKSLLGSKSQDVASLEVDIAKLKELLSADKKAVTVERLVYVKESTDDGEMKRKLKDLMREEEVYRAELETLLGKAELLLEDRNAELEDRNAELEDRSAEIAKYKKRESWFKKGLLLSVGLVASYFACKRLGAGVSSTLSKAGSTFACCFPQSGWFSFSCF